MLVCTLRPTSRLDRRTRRRLSARKLRPAGRHGNRIHRPVRTGYPRRRAGRRTSRWIDRTSDPPDSLPAVRTRCLVAGDSHMLRAPAAPSAPAEARCSWVFARRNATSLSPTVQQHRARAHDRLQRNNHGHACFEQFGDSAEPQDAAAAADGALPATCGSRSGTNFAVQTPLRSRSGTESAVWRPDAWNGARCGRGPVPRAPFCQNGAHGDRYTNDVGWSHPPRGADVGRTVCNPPKLRALFWCSRCTTCAHAP